MWGYTLGEVLLALCIGVFVTCLLELRELDEREHRRPPRGKPFHKPPKDI